MVKWERPLAITNVLLYELNIEPIIRSGDDLNIKEKCKTENRLNTKIVSAVSFLRKLKKEIFIFSKLILLGYLYPMKLFVNLKLGIR